MPVKTFVVGVMNGWADSFRTLDKMVEDLVDSGEVVLIEDMILSELNRDTAIRRLVVYEDEKVYDDKD